MSNVDRDTATTYADLDWTHYISSRPSYPPSLKKLIYDYRRTHPQAGWQRVVDVGGGIGVSSTLFASDFEIVHLLDPSPKNHEQARVFLTQWRQSHALSTELEFTEATAERGFEFVKDADMVICAETAHFINSEQLMESAVRMLRPGGTLAIYSYWMPTFPEQSEHLSEAFGKAITQTLGLCLRSDNDATHALFRNVFARLSAGQSVLDSIPVSEDLFDDIQRIRINIEAEKSLDIFNRTFPVSCEPLPSRVGNREKQTIYDSRKHAQAEGWYFRVDNKWLHDFMDTMRPAEIELSKIESESIYGDWDQAFQEECPSGFVWALWPVNIVLATRK